MTDTSDTGVKRGGSKQRPYTMAYNDILWHPEMTMKAKGLLMCLLSFPPDWIIYRSHLLKKLPEGKDSIRSSMNELVKFGFVQIRQKTNENGQFCGGETIVFDEPQERDENYSPSSETGFDSEFEPQAENPPTVTPPLIRLTNNKTKIHSSSFDNGGKSSPEKTPSRSSKAEEGNLNKDFKVEERTSQDQITSKVSDERSKTVMSSTSVGKFKTLESIPPAFSKKAQERFRVKPSRIVAVEDDFLERFSNNEYPKTLEKWGDMWFNFVNNRQGKVPEDFELPQKDSETHEYKNRIGFDKTMSTLVKDILKADLFFTYIEQGTFEEVSDKTVKFSTPSTIARDWFDDHMPAILKKRGFTSIDSVVTGLKS